MRLPRGEDGAAATRPMTLSVVPSAGYASAPKKDGGTGLDELGWKTTTLVICSGTEGAVTGMYYTIEEGFVRISGEGRVMLDDELAVLWAAVGAAGFVEGMDPLIGVTRSAESRSPREIERLAGLRGGLRPQTGERCAIVVGSQLNDGPARMLSAHADSYGVRVRAFADPEPARYWLCGNR